MTFIGTSSYMVWCLQTAWAGVRRTTHRARVSA